MKTDLLPQEIQRKLEPYHDRIEVVVHAPVKTCVEVCEVVRVPPSSVAKGVLWEGARDRGRVIILTVVPADRRVSVPHAKAAAGAETLSLAKEPERITGYEAGSIPPFALPSNVLVFLHRFLAKKERIWFGSGVATISLVAGGETLVALSGAEVADLCEE